MYRIIQAGDTIRISGVDCFDPIRSCASGQVFRFRPQGGGVFGVARGRALYVECRNGELTLQGLSLIHI